MLYFRIHRKLLYNTETYFNVKLKQAVHQSHILLWFFLTTISLMLELGWLSKTQFSQVLVFALSASAQSASMFLSHGKVPCVIEGQRSGGRMEVGDG